MLEKKDLRVGNWVEFKKPSGFDYCRLTKSSFEGNYISNSFKPAKIDEQWLENFGFLKYFFKKGFYMFKNVAVFEEENMFWLFNSKEDVPVKINYVHELQNTFFELYGTELEFSNK